MSVMPIATICTSLIVNLLLAVIPVGLAWLLVRLTCSHWRAPWRVIAMLPLSLLWLLFVPNTCYLISEWHDFLDLVPVNHLLHRWEMNSDPMAIGWLAGLMTLYLFSSLFGMIAFVLSVRPLIPLVSRYVSRKWLTGIPFFFLMTLAISLGNNPMLRFSSWDMLTSPNLVIQGAISMLARPYQLPFLLACAGFLWLGYLFFDVWIDGLLHHRKRIATTTRLQKEPCHRPIPDKPLQ